MNTQDILKYGDQFFVQTLERAPQSTWTTPNVCGVWSVKDIVAHLASFELMLNDVLHSLIDESAPTPTLSFGMEVGPEAFNDLQVEKRKEATPQAVFDEYAATFAQNHALIAQISLADQTTNGILPWYGEEYDLQDYIAYTFYGHKREHGAQVAVFADTLTT